MTGLHCTIVFDVIAALNVAMALWLALRR